MKHRISVLLAMAATGVLFSGNAPAADDAAIARGRYLLLVGGCNDCHTAGYGLANGKVAEKDWLQGDSIGWRGPWGTTYASNLRLYFQGVSETQWLKTAKTMEYRPPMPWFTLRQMKERDLRDLYRFVRSLGPAGKPAPDYVPPDRQPAGPVIQFPAPPK